MNTTAHRTSIPTGVRPDKSNGQWAVDGSEPLNGNEEVKAADNGLNVRQRIIDTYAKEGFASIPSDDLNGRMRWWGLYTQRRQGIDGGRTGQVSPEELSDEFFMMRVRLDGGALTTEQVRVLGDISVDFARSTADISDRQNLQYHWIRIEDVPTIWQRLEDAGMQTTMACGDTPRVIMGSPVAGIAADEIIDPTPAIAEIVEKYIGDPEVANLPRKFKSAITGHPSLDVVHEINDISLVGVVHPELGPGYDLWVGGALSVAPRLAERLGAFVPPERAAEVWYGVVRLFRDYGYRRLRNRARLKFLLADWGAEKFRHVLETEFLDGPLPDGPAPEPSGQPGDHIGIHEQKDGRLYVGFAPTVGRVGGTVLHALADAAEAAGSSRIRFTAHQKVLVLDVDPDKVDGLIEAAQAVGLTATPSPFRRSTIACTGIEYCKLAFVETKGMAAATITALEERLSDVTLDRPISLHINGCPNSCARIQVADIGLKGQVAKGPDGDKFSFQVHLGGGLADESRSEAELGRTLRGLKVAADELPDYLERVVRRFQGSRTQGETFSAWVARIDEEALR
ncbi:MAG TPA: nitrite/sulfite reductase [Propionibacteriaceae bacterium]|nr:nitrite/sulfite reductase [Propionibacteriaceae bacterium]